VDRTHHGGGAIRMAAIWVVATFSSNSYLTRKGHFHRGVKPHIQRIKNLDGPFQGDTKGFVTFVPRYLRFVHLQAICEISLRQALSNPYRNQQRPQAAKILKLIELTTFGLRR